ncbi:inosine-5'-monophosphate dehydrogenase [Cutibacterium acnes JCM 18909]|nr:inosine-5'-monophosphate dehydrogenase [Cutibacterium acnes JCM 18909]
MRFLNEQPNYDLTYNDVFMAPNRSSVGSRMNVDLTSTDGLGTPLPLVVANMTAISGRRMAETIARRGGIAVLPQDIPADFVARSIRRVKDAHTRFDTPVTVNPTTTVGEAMNLLNKRAHGVVLVVEDHRPVGLVSPIEAEGVDRFAQCHEVMTTDLTLVGPQASPDDVFQTLAERHQKVAVAVDENGLLVGIMTSRGALRTEIYRPAVDPEGHLMIGTAIGINGDVAERARNALESGSDVLVMDTAHGHQDQMIRAIEIADEARTAFETKTGRRVPSSPAISLPAAAPSICWRRVRTSLRSASDRAPCAPLGCRPGWGVRSFRQCWSAPRLLPRLMVPSGLTVGCVTPAMLLLPCCRRRIGHDWLVVRGYPRIDRGHAHRPRWPDVQGVLRHGLGSRRASPYP